MTRGMKGQLKKAEKLWIEYLKQKGLKFTPERRTILEAACAMDTHFEADEVFLRLRQGGSGRISRATVYRTLPLLEACGLIRKVVFTDKHTHYENVYGGTHHEHLICLNCGKVIEFYRQPLEDTLEAIAHENKFKALAHKLEITGFCEQCIRKKG